MDKLSDNLKCLIFERVSTVIPLHFVCKNFYQLCKLYNIQITNNYLPRNDCCKSFIGYIQMV